MVMTFCTAFAAIKLLMGQQKLHPDTVESSVILKTAFELQLYLLFMTVFYGC